MIRVLVVDDHPVVRQGLVALLSDNPELQVVGSAGSAAGIVELVDRLAPDVVLMDLEMPDVDGVAAIAALSDRPARVVVFTAYDNDERVLGALKAGARGYVLKGASAEEIARAITTVHEGGSYLEPRVAARVVSQMQSPSRAGLSPRERSVLQLIAAGLSNKEIAAQLRITERTAKFHVTSILNKLGAENRAQSVALAAQRGLL